jgi:riboflavin biosynthesis pyrimidine reductase
MAIADRMDWAHERVAKALAQGPNERVVAVLISSLDHVAAIDGRSVGLTSDADRALVRAWREVADLLLVGSRTLEAELYSGAILDEVARNRRVEEGRSSLPPVVTIDRSHTLDVDLALRGDDHPRLIVYVTSEVEHQDPRADWVVLPDAAIVEVLRDARDRLGARVIVAEGGPRLIRSAFEEELVTDLSLTIAPLHVGKGPLLFDASKEPAHRELLPAEAVDDYVFAHWVIAPAARAHANGNV